VTLRALVVDDEAVARRRVARLLSERDDVELAGEAAGGEAALEAIERLRPDIVFLDIQMPDLDGFEVLRRLPGEQLPAVVFVTAWDQHALRAFEACAIDYLLKPYETDRFHQAVDRAARWARQDGEVSEERRLRELLREVIRGERTSEGGQGAAQPLERFLVKHRGRSEFVRATDVDWIEADGNYVRLHVGAADHLVRGTIASCAERLDPRRFVRVHRRFIVNLDRVREVQPWFGGDQVILLHGGHKLRLSRSFRELFQSRMLGD
jgi:two-component system LytT family response regulator